MSNPENHCCLLFPVVWLFILLQNSLGLSYCTFSFVVTVSGDVHVPNKTAFIFHTHSKVHFTSDLLQVTPRCSFPATGSRILLQKRKNLILESINGQEDQLFHCN